MGPDWAAAWARLTFWIVLECLPGLESVHVQDQMLPEGAFWRLANYGSYPDACGHSLSGTRLVLREIALERL